MKLKHLFFGALFLISAQPFAQTQNSAYTAIGKGVATTFLSDYQCLGINNSALGWGTGFEGKQFTMGTSEFAFGLSSPTLDKERLKNAYKAIYNQVADKENEDFDYAAQRDAAADYAEAGMAINVNYNWFGASYQNEKFGGIAVSVRENYSWFSQLNEQTTDIIFRGRLSSYFDSLTIAIDGDTTTIGNTENLSQDTLAAVISGRINDPLLLSDITNGSRIKFVWNREYNFGYGRKIFGSDSTFALYGGIGGRYIQSMAMFDLQSDESGISVRSAISPFYDINYGQTAGTSPTSGSSSGFLPSAVGQGYGVDLSASVILLGKIRLAASVNNIGSITYNREVYSVRDTLVGEMSLPGLDDSNITEALTQLNEEGGLLRLEGEQEFVVTNPANFRLGGSMQMFKKKLHIGFDVVAPFNKDHPGSLQNAIVSVGGDIRPVKWLQISAGYFGGGVYQHNIPVGINFILGGGTYEVGISSRDALSFFLKDANSISTAFGFARFRF